MGDGFGMMGWGWLVGLLMLAGLVLLVAFAVRAVGGSLGMRDAGRAQLDPGRTGEGAQRHARAILDERYARGELSTEEYRERLRALTDEADWY